MTRKLPINLSSLPHHRAIESEGWSTRRAGTLKKCSV